MEDTITIQTASEDVATPRRSTPFDGIPGRVLAALFARAEQEGATEVVIPKYWIDRQNRA